MTYRTPKFDAPITDEMTEASVLALEAKHEERGAARERAACADLVRATEVEIFALIKNAEHELRTLQPVIRQQRMARAIIKDLATRIESRGKPAGEPEK